MAEVKEELEKEEGQILSIPRKKDTTASTAAVVKQEAVASPPSDPRVLKLGFVDTTPSRPTVDGTTMGLPQGVRVPTAVDSKLLQGRLLETLIQLPVDLINDALIEYDDALKNKGGSIRNQGAYLYGVVKRYKSVTERAASGQGDSVMGQTVTPLVQQRLDKLVQDGVCTQDEMNEKVKNKIRMLSEKDALFAIDELSSVERGSIRNFSSYFMGILNRYMRGDKSSSRDRNRSYNDSYGRNDRNGGRYNRGRSPDRRDYRSHRDRSRDRFDDDRRNNYRSPNNNSYSRSRYDPRQQQPYQGQQQHYAGSGVPPPPPPRQPPTMNYVPPQQQMHPPQQQMHPPQQQQMQQMQQQPPQQMYMQQPNQLVQPAQQMASNQFVQQQPGAPAPLGLPPGSTFVPQQPQQSIPTQQQQSMNQQIPGVPGQQQQPAYMSNTMQQQQQSPMIGTQQQPQTMGMTNQQQQPQLGIPNMSSSYGAPAPSTYSTAAPAPPAGIPDILGLADKAAQALQASAVVSNPAPAAPQMHIQPSPYTAAAAPRPRGRTTATMEELPIMVQYAVKNLQATGHVDGVLDDGILGMIKDLPEPLALQSLEKFSSIDTKTMRNKTAYLAGVLRRELEKIRRR